MAAPTSPSRSIARASRPAESGFTSASAYVAKASSSQGSRNCELPTIP
jgi:hypothetical protein